LHEVAWYWRALWGEPNRAWFLEPKPGVEPVQVHGAMPSAGNANAADRQRDGMRAAEAKPSMSVMSVPVLSLPMGDTWALARRIAPGFVPTEQHIDCPVPRLFVARMQGGRSRAPSAAALESKSGAVTPAGDAAEFTGTGRHRARTGDTRDTRVTGSSPRRLKGALHDEQEWYRLVEDIRPGAWGRFTGCRLPRAEGKRQEQRRGLD